MDFFRGYLEKNRDTLLTLAVVLAIDHYFLGGALREKIKGIVERFLNKAEDRMVGHDTK